MADWIVDVMREGGYLAVAGLMLAETVLPPVPSEVVMPVAGLLAAEGEVSLAGVVIAGSAGSLAGAYAWYAVARAIGAERLTRWADRHGRWLTLSANDIRGVSRWFDRYGTTAVLFGRLIPGIRSLISLPAGIAEMPLRKFLTWTAVGTVAWSGALAVAGFVLRDRYEGITQSVGLLSNVVMGGAVLLYVYRLVTFKHPMSPDPITKP